MMNITRVDIACVSVFCPGLLSLLSRFSPRSEIKEIFKGDSERKSMEQPLSSDWSRLQLMSLLIGLRQL